MYQERIKIDWLTVGIWALLLIFGWMNIYSATYTEPPASIFDLHTFHGKQLLFIGVSIFAAVILLILDPRIYSDGAYFIYIAVMAMLVATLFLAVTVKGGKSWIDINGFRFQPTEFGKFATALALSKYMSGVNVEWRDTRTKFVAAAIVLVPMALVFLQHDTGSALVFVCFILPLFREGLSATVLIVGVVAVLLFVLALLIDKYILIAIVIAIGLLYLFVWLNKRTARDWWITALLVVLCAGFIFSVDLVFNHVLESHQSDRINVLLGKDVDLHGTAYNVNQSKIAIGSGALIGKGYLGGTLTKSRFVPERHTDFIFCTVGEEWGWVGSTALIAVYVWLFSHLIVMAERQRSRFSRFYGYCVASILFVHFFVNIGMTIGVIPVIGIPLPFFSSGGSSMVAFTILLFIFIRLDATKNQLY